MSLLFKSDRQVFRAVNDLGELLNYEVELFDKLVGFGELSELDSLDEGLVELLSEVVSRINLHH